MSELLPTVQADNVREGLIDYLTTTFALADEDAGAVLNEFLSDPSSGIFRGPYLRLRLPFREAADGWQQTLGDWYDDFPPYGHQAAAFARLSSIGLGPEKPRPLPTLVTTGTGSGKTEAFLYPTVDHVLRAKQAGITGTKALILYPMNALANDQAQRLAALITGNSALSGVTAALYTGQDVAKRTVVTPEGLITDRYAIRQTAPDILLTNYKMLDQLLLRHEDAALWEQSAMSLQYLVLDEFHTYDGAQGTDVAMLLRRLGLRLKSYWTGSAAVSDADRARPLGRITPVATSATLGDKGDPAAMIEFAHTVFGEAFDPGAVVTEARLTHDEWAGDAAPRLRAAGLLPAEVTGDVVGTLNAAVRALDERGAAVERAGSVLQHLVRTVTDEPLDAPPPASTWLDLVKAHPWIRALVEASTDAVGVRDLAGLLFPVAALTTGQTGERVEFIANVVSALSHVRKVSGRASVSVDLHLWVRELTRIDRVASAATTFLWSDDGEVELADQQSAFDSRGTDAFPAVYCRHCGRSGWGVALGPVGYDLANSDDAIRRDHASHNGRFRALLFAPNEADQALNSSELDQAIQNGLRFFAVRQRSLLDQVPPDDDPDFLAGAVLPVLTLVGDDADTESQDDRCPSCLQEDGIRFLGSAISTLLSVTLSTMFGTANLDRVEKKALVFTDSVQDAAHRAGFVQSRSHTLTLRSVLRDAVGDDPITLDALVDEVLQRAGDDPFRRYRILPPELVDRDEFPRFWDQRTLRQVPPKVLTRVKRRLLLDASLEFGLQSRLGRTLELTGSVVAEVSAGPSSRLSTLARPLLDGYEARSTLDEVDAELVPDETLVAWVRGVLERMRERGAIAHPWLDSYVNGDGDRWKISGGRPRSQGMPAFPPGRPAPAFPKVGGAAAKNSKSDNLDSVGSPQSWYATWTSKLLHVSPHDGGRLAVTLLRELAKVGILAMSNSASGAEIFQIQPSSIVLKPTQDADLEGGKHALVCSICNTIVPGSIAVVDQLEGAPCTVVRCRGRLQRDRRRDNYYRRLYRSTDMRRIVAREHTSLLDDETRLRYENGFKSAQQEPQSPNVLVATPTLEMGIDIGDLSTVMLASLPRSVASYLQRVGRAGRLTGNSLNLAFVTGRGENLPRLGEPLSVINGRVRPPATYLSADEILRRQYLAHLVDEFARDGDRQHPRTAAGAIGNAEPDSFLGDLIREAEEQADVHLDRFLAAFKTLSPGAVEALRSWASPEGGAGTSALAQYLFEASARWRATVDTLGFRRQEIEKSLPELHQRAELPAATADDKRAFRTASAALRLTKHELGELKGEHWVAVLEEYGILPNYTLLDDSVTLDVALSWIDPDTDQYQTDSVAYKRGASNALRELAPGATFYAHGLEVLIDAVDLGMEGSAIRTWAHCPACGFAADLEVSGKAIVVNACPRCGSQGIADKGQRFEVVELERVSAEIRRDEAQIGDSREQRKRERFTQFIAADIDQKNVVKEWYVEGSGFGTKYLRQVTVRWLNAGKAGVSAPTATIAGQEQPASLFRVCESCGKLDQSSRTNRPNEHRAWCPHRKSHEEHPRIIALSRTLTTQGIVLRLPPALTIGDYFAVPSLSAALLLGLREQIGGAPDHIQVAEVVDPTPSDGGDNNSALLLHDVVPGGTGYLAELAHQDRIRDLLLRAYRIVRDCECRGEARLACHRCLLPFARPDQVDHVSRQDAERLLHLLLVGDASEEPTQETTWVTSEIPPGNFDPESHLEQLFRVAFTQRITALGGLVQEVPGAKGNKLLVTGVGSSGRWTLSPQVPTGNSLPDFTLQSANPALPDVHIFTDGKAFHASTVHNRLADDAFKREVLRDLGAIVLGVTWQDLDPHGSWTPKWFVESMGLTLMDDFHINRDALTTVSGSPLDFIAAWIQNPESDLRRDVANAVPVIAMAAGAEQLGLDADRSLLDVAVDAVATPQAGSVGTDPAWIYRRGALIVASRAIGGQVTNTEAVVILDDRAEALQTDGFDAAWREWLHLSNAMMLRTRPTTITTYSRAIEDTPVAAAVVDVPLGPVDLYEPAWTLVYESASGDGERAFVRALAELGVPVPTLGLESQDGIPIAFAWDEAKVAADLQWQEEDRRDLQDEGWTVVEADPAAVAAAVMSEAV